MLDEEQVKNIKEQIIKQIDSWQASSEKKQEAKKYILSLNKEQLEEFLIKNKMIKPETEKTQIQKPQSQTVEKQETQCPFCLIIQEKIPSYKIDENSKSIAVLEINPLSEGHALIIPKQHKNIEKIPSQAFSLAKKISGKIKRKLKAQSTSIQSAELFGHSAINIIPIYEGKSLEKKHSSEQELKELQEKLIAKPRIKTEKKTRRIKKENLPKYPKRIP